jgi:hypothetical protein
MRYAAEGGAASTGSPGQIALQVARQAVHRLVPACPVLIQSLHQNPIQLSVQDLGQPCRIGLPQIGDFR